MRSPGWRLPSAELVVECERLVAIDARLPAILRGETAARDAGDRIDLAGVCTKRRLYAASSRFYGDAFAAVAALAGSGKGKDDPPPDDAARAGLRSRAVRWLRDDLAAWVKILDGGDPKAAPFLVNQLAHWKVDADLAGIRDAQLVKLPEPEREAYRSLWADVEALRRKAEAKATPAGAK